MSLLVQKFGGTSVATTECIRKVANIVVSAQQSGHKVIAVVSAMSGDTDRLINLAKEINNKVSGRELDALMSTGEQISMALLCMAIAECGAKAISLNASQIEIRTDSTHNKARIQSINDKRIKEELSSGKIVVVPGFQGVDAAGNITTLGRGGSDTSAVALAAALGADECQIFTDVRGVFTTDPRIEDNAKKIDRLTFEEMLEMSSQGSKVLQIRSVEFASKYDIPIRVASTFENNDSGTLISKETTNMEEPIISGIAFNRDEAQLTIRGVQDQPGIASKILGPISAANVEIDMIVQNVGEDGAANFTFTVHRNDYKQAFSLLEESAKQLNASKVGGDDTIVKLSLVGVGMRSHAGIASKMFDLLAKENINIHMISTSEIKISVVIHEQDLDNAVKILHVGFDLGN